MRIAKDLFQRALSRVLFVSALISLLANGAVAQVPSAQVPPFQPSTFMAAANIAPAALTAGDLFCITGSATRLVKVKSIRLNGVVATTAQTDAFAIIKRSAASTGGTLTNPTAVALDTTQVIPTATATINAYTGVPTPGAAVGTLSIQYLALPSAAGTITDDLAWVWSPQNLNSDVRLRGAAQQLCVNSVNAFPTTAPTLAVEIMWTEQ